MIDKFAIGGISVERMLDYLNKRDIEVNTLDGARKAINILLEDDLDRINHSISVSQKALEIAREVGYGDLTQVEMAGLLHDIGYSSKISFADFHPIDGYYYLGLNDWEKEYREVALYHSFSEELALNYRKDLSSEYRRLPYEESENKALIEIITKADFLVDNKGNYVSFEKRLKGIESRYGKESCVYIHACDSIKKLKNRWD